MQLFASIFAPFLQLFATNENTDFHKFASQISKNTCLNHVQIREIHCVIRVKTRPQRKLAPEILCKYEKNFGRKPNRRTASAMLIYEIRRRLLTKKGTTTLMR